MNLLAPYNLVFVLPFVGALMYLLLMAFGGVGHSDGGVETDGGFEADQDFDHDVDHGIEHSVEHGHDHEHDAGHESGSLLRSTFSFLGFGRVPISLVIMSWCFVWGFTGWAANTLLAPLVPPAIFVIPSLVIALICSVAVTRYLAIGLSKVLPTTESYASSNQDLVGQLAEVRFKVTDKSGTAMVLDQYRNLREVPCRVKAGQEPIPAGEKVVLMKYDREQEAFIVLTDPLQSIQ